MELTINNSIILHKSIGLKIFKWLLYENYLSNLHKIHSTYRVGYKDPKY